MDDRKNIAETLAQEMRKPEVFDVRQVPQAFVPENFKREDLSHLMAAPPRPKGQTTLYDAASFIDFVNDEITAATRIYCKADYTAGDVKFKALFNGSTAGFPGWGDHAALYQVPITEEWKRWVGKNAQPFGQAEFALWLEDNMKDIADAQGFPTAAMMLEMALQFEANQDARFKNFVRLQSGGVEMTYVNQDDDATLLKMKMFDRFKLGIAPFLNGQPYGMTARLRYRAREGKVSFWYELIRPDLIVADAVRDLIVYITDKIDRPLYLGWPS